MSKIKTARIEIDLKFGSDWQFHTQLKAIVLMVGAYKYHMEAAHKNNKTDYKLLDK